MRNFYKSILAISAAAMAFSGCVEEQSLVPQENGDTKTITVIAGPQPENLTKTQMEGKDVIWSSDEKINLYIDQRFLHPTPKDQPDNHNYDVVITPDHKLQATLHNIPAQAQYLDGFFGAGFSFDAQISSKEQGVSAFGIILPAIQNVTTSTFDPLADALVMDRIDISNTNLAQPVAYARYNRLHAITKLSFTGLDNYAGENVSTVEFKVKDAHLAGEFTYDFINKKFVSTSGVEKTGSIFNLNQSKSVVMKFPQNTLLDGNFAAWMVTAAQTLKTNEVVTVKITTDKHAISGSFKLPVDKVFTNTQLNTLTLNMSKAKVTDQSQIVADGDYVIAYKDSGKYYAMTTDYQKANERLDFVEVQYNGEEDIAAEAKYMWHIAAAGNKFAISNGALSLKAAKNQTKLTGTTDPLPNDCLFTIDAGSAAGTFIVTAHLEDKGGDRTLKRNGINGFGFYSEQDNEVCLIPAVEDNTPRITFAEESFTAIAEATVLDIPFSRNKFATGEVTVKITSGSEWLAVSKKTIPGTESEINCTFGVNDTDVERTATLEVSCGGFTAKPIIVKQSVKGSAVSRSFDWADVVSAQSPVWKTNDFIPATFTYGDFVFAFAQSGSTKPRTWSNNTELRIYRNEMMTIKLADTSKQITKIIFDSSLPAAVSSGTLSGTTWTGESNSVTYTVNNDAGTQKIKSFNIFYK